MHMSWIKKIIFILRDVLVFVLIGFLTLEFFAFILSYNSLLMFNETPRFYENSKKVISIGEFRTEYEPWGAWHKPDSIAKSSSSCFNVEYISNEIGARDKSFSQIPNHNNYVLIGDSFAEGYGVNYENTVQYLIENKTGFNIMNFGTAGDFGPVQYYLIYNQLAKKYSHDGLIIFFLPANDFKDNDFVHWGKKHSKSKRWRPYYQKEKDGSYSTFIPNDSIKRLNTKPVFTTLEKYLWSMNVFKTYKHWRLSSRKDRIESGYFDATLNQQKAAVFFIEKLIAESNAQKIILISIPTMPDFVKIDKGFDKNKTYWHQSFQELPSKLGKNIQFIDLADYVKPKQDNGGLFLKCDGHWSAEGNKWAAEVISNYLKQ